MANDRQTDDEVRGIDQTRRGLFARFGPTLLTLVIGYATLAVIQWTDFSFTKRVRFDFLWIIALTQLSIYITIRVYSRIALGWQIAVLVAVYGMQYCLYESLRIDGFMGDGRPMLAWIWSPDSAWKDPPSADARQVTADVRESPRDSPSFRGADRNGVYAGAALARDWSRDRPRLLWKRPIGLGWSSFAAVGEYCFTQEQRGEFETVVCYELKTGRQVWEHRDAVHFREVTGGHGPRATPAYHKGRVFAQGATGILNCLDARTGQRLWRADILRDNQTVNRLFGMVGSPLIHGDRVVVAPGGKRGSLAAYNQTTGAREWSGGQADASYSSPHYAAFRQPQLLIFNAEGLFGHQAASGEVLWSVPWVSNPAERNNVCQPVAIPHTDDEEDLVFIASGYGRGCALWEIIDQDGKCEVRERWRNRNLKAKFSSVVRQGGFVFGFDGNIMTCIDLSTGERRWKRGRYGFGQLLRVNDLLIVQAESGEVVLLEASPLKHVELGRFQALDGRTWNHPVLAGRLLLVRNDRQAACYELPLATD